MSRTIISSYRSVSGGVSSAISVMSRW